MKFKSIEWKNIFAYGEDIQKVEYIDGELVLLKGQSGAGKSAILFLPSLLLYGKTDKKLTKSGIANRTNKHGWIKGIIQKGGHEYIIERCFAPNSLEVFKDGTNINSFGTSSAQDYIDKEIADIPLKAFANMISISMKKFKSFLTMSPADRKEIIDRVFNLEAINLAYEQIKKDGREVGAQINANNSTLFQLTQTLSNATSELEKVKDNIQDEKDKEEIQKNIDKISEDNSKIEELRDNYVKASAKQQEITTSINDIKKKQYENNFNISTIVEKINLFSQEKCPTCGTHFNGENYQNIKQQLIDLKAQKDKISFELNEQLQSVNETYTKINDYLVEVNSAIYQLRSDVQSLTTRNNTINENLSKNVEFQGIQNIINNTSEQIDIIKNQLSNDTIKLKDLQNLAIVYSIDGVKQKVIVNYLPNLNQEISKKLGIVNFPYDLVIDTKFEPHLKELGIEIEAESLSDGEETRVDLIILCSLFKLLKRRFPTINILTIDEVISSLDSETSGMVLDFLKVFAKDNNLSCFIVSHTDLYLDNFDKIINVKKEGFSHIEISIPKA